MGLHHACCELRYEEEQKICKLRLHILSNNVIPEFLQLILCSCPSHQVSCHICCGTILGDNLTSVLHCANEVIAYVNMLQPLSIHRVFR